MTQEELARLEHAELRDRLKAHADQPNNTQDVDLHEALRYLIALPDDKHTAESVDALTQIGRSSHYAAQPVEALQAASHAARLAVVLQHKLLLCKARAIEGVSLSDLGRFAEATVAQVECVSLARDLGDKEREIWAIGNFGTLCGGMGQWNVAMRYFERTRELGERYGLPKVEFLARTNLADCAVQLRDPALGLRILSKFNPVALPTRQDIAISAAAHNTAARLQLLAGDVDAAQVHARASARLSKVARMEKVTRSTEAVLGLIDVLSGAVKRGLSVVDRELMFARDANHTELPDYLNICIDAYEAAGYSDRALEYLYELVTWKKKSVEAAVLPLQYEGLTNSIQFQTGISLFDNGLFAKAHSLESGVRDRIQRLVETAINAEIGCGHDIYRTFRVAKLAHHLAAAIGWDEERIATLTLGAQLCNIGMMAIPARIVQKPRGLSDSERHVLRDHTKYGAELLRKSKLRILDVATVLAEQHHERYDGSGYPHGLSGGAIAEEARIVAVCDAFDAMTHSRPWRVAALSTRSALNELKQGAGSQFEPLLVTAFVDLIEREFSACNDLDVLLAEGADEFEYVRARARMEALIADR